MLSCVTPSRTLHLCELMLEGRTREDQGAGVLGWPGCPEACPGRRQPPVGGCAPLTGGCQCRAPWGRCARSLLGEAWRVRGWVRAAAARRTCSALSLCPGPCPQPCLPYWPEPGRQQYGLMEVEFVSGTADEDLVARVFRVQNISRVSDLGAPG